MGEFNESDWSREVNELVDLISRLDQKKHNVSEICRDRGDHILLMVGLSSKAYNNLSRHLERSWKDWRVRAWSECGRNVAVPSRVG